MGRPIDTEDGPRAGAASELAEPRRGDLGPGGYDRAVEAGGHATDRHEELLRRFQPCLRYDSLETYFADAAEIWLANPDCRLSDREGETIATPADGLSLSFLRRDRYPNGHAVDRGDFTESTSGDYQEIYGRLRSAHEEFRNVIYARSVESHGRLWLQYWFFYFFNDYQLAWGIGIHEGDWEMIQLRMKPPVEEGGAPVEPEIAVYAQHNFCEVRPWSDVRRLAVEQSKDGGTPDPGAEDRPLVYVGRGSHASFFEPGYHETDFYDITNGERSSKKGARLELIGDPPPDWLRWPGRWGGTRAGGRGPEAPCSQSQWDDPEKLLKRSPRVRRRERAPDAPRVMARRRRGRLLLEFDFRTTPEPPRWLVVTVNSPDEKGVPPHAHSFGVEDVSLGSLDTRIELDPKKCYDVSLAVVDKDGRPTAAEVVIFAPSTGWKGIRGRVGAAFGRVVHLVRLATGRQ